LDRLFCRPTGTPLRRGNMLPMRKKIPFDPLTNIWQWNNILIVYPSVGSLQVPVRDSVRNRAYGLPLYRGSRLRPQPTGGAFFMRPAPFRRAEKSD